MKKITLIIITILLVNPFFGQNNKNLVELTVINMPGAKIYEKPTFDSKTFTDLPLGKTFNIDHQIESKEKYQIGKEFSLTGK